MELPLALTHASDLFENQKLSSKSTGLMLASHATSHGNLVSLALFSTASKIASFLGVHPSVCQKYAAKNVHFVAPRWTRCWQFRSEAETGSPAPGVVPSCDVDGRHGAGDGPPPQRTAEECGGGAKRRGGARNARRPTVARSASRCPMTKQRLLEGCGWSSFTTLQYRRWWKRRSRTSWSRRPSRCSCVAVDGRTGPQSPRWVLPVVVPHLTSRRRPSLESQRCPRRWRIPGRPFQELFPRRVKCKSLSRAETKLCHVRHVHSFVASETVSWKTRTSPGAVAFYTRETGTVRLMWRDSKSMMISERVGCRWPVSAQMEKRERSSGSRANLPLESWPVSSKMRLKSLRMSRTRRTLRFFDKSLSHDQNQGGCSDVVWSGGPILSSLRFHQSNCVFWGGLYCLAMSS